MEQREKGKAIGGIVVAALVLLIAVTTGAGTSAAQSPQAKAKQYKGTRAIIVDSATGELRLPTQQEVDAAVKSISNLVPRPVEEANEKTVSSGAIAVSLDGGGVVLARPNGDGTFETRCVFTFEEGADFLGIVEAESIQ
jgi:gas vesicle protein